MLLSVLGGKDMIGALSALETVAHEGQQRVVLLLRRTEKGADMPIAAEHRAGKGDGCGRVHGAFLAGFSHKTAPLANIHALNLFLSPSIREYMERNYQASRHPLRNAPKSA